ncbi:MAG TPA: hypothetical protein ENL12_02745 [Dehalococcoidia bacterium]|nr:hypothetical protein [Dehalococcoidia bacterium]
MGAFEDFVARIHNTDTMQELVRSLDNEPARLLQRICARYEETGRPVPDHYLQLTGFFGEMMLHVLVRAGLIQLHSGERGALHHYEPTLEGLELSRRMREENESTSGAF